MPRQTRVVGFFNMSPTSCEKQPKLPSLYTESWQRGRQQVALSVKLHLTDVVTNGRTDEETRLFVVRPSVRLLDGV